MKTSLWEWLTMFGLAGLVVSAHPAWLIPFVIGAIAVIRTEHTPGS